MKCFLPGDRVEIRPTEEAWLYPGTRELFRGKRGVVTREGSKGSKPLVCLDSPVGGFAETVCISEENLRLISAKEPRGVEFLSVWHPSPLEVLDS